MYSVDIIIKKKLYRNRSVVSSGSIFTRIINKIIKDKLLWYI